MPPEVRNDFIFDIKREINNISFLAQNLLKLSKLDTNTVKFLNEDIYLKDIISEVLKNLSMLCELKNIKINVFQKDDAIINVVLNGKLKQ